ncbi:putative phage HK022 GP20-related protein [Rhodopseudomonas palustris TIE-1]|uniref:tail assembly protein n=1 Tax=Rhodopseudomonas palustris TaxID=1076 RepID=UPI000164B30C|nr:tail assembly protein [Rhodopseudomonas palustris]ACF02472.1 putative phage HK022 GP20-related protein [Rhodopseudomonas palustris TIE-1]
MMRTIHLHGRLKTLFGPKHRFDVLTAAEALRALNCAFPGEFVKELSEGAYCVVRGNRHSGMQLDIELVTSFKLGNADLHIIPVAAGAANGTNKAVGKTILGTVLIGAAVFMSGGAAGGLLAGMGAQALTGVGITWGNIALVGLGLALSGGATLLANASDPTTSDTKTDESFTTAGPTNLAQQGAAIPLIYGETMTGSNVISFDADIEDIRAYQDAQGSMADYYLGAFQYRVGNS